ncbi:hypothetical protein F5Y13DRAFT_144262 [Hypoxylon sp. FL1857]|nr:hypothetical protein F5Y13DRAFT_144262 [Hypoxylon sp. FL1857]
MPIHHHAPYLIRVRKPLFSLTINMSPSETCSVDPGNDGGMAIGVGSIYMSDILKSTATHVDEPSCSAWVFEFRASRWFTRGSTL